MGQGLGLTPLHMAAKYGHVRIVESLIYHGALLTARNKAGLIAEDVARAANNVYIANYLQRIAPLTQQLLKASCKIKSLMVALTERSKTLPNELRNIYVTACIENNRGEIQQSLQQIKQLIRQGAEVNAQDKKGYTSLHCLIGYYNPEGPTQFDEEVRALIDSGLVNLDAVADNGDTALSLAAHFGNSRIFNYLLKKGANPMIGTNPFKIALQHNQPQLLRHLLMGSVKQTKKSAVVSGSKGPLGSAENELLKQKGEDVF